ncbi:MAG TPA: TetR/AcrR family transcriptional regulator [Streptosporangiaceae bacterium]
METASAPAGAGTGNGTGGSAAAPARRPRNARGEGGRLAEDIVSGALALIDRTGSEEAVTLRAVAREIGIAAPSIYAHFADREAIIMAAVLQIFGELFDAITTGADSAGPDPVDRLVAGCAAYLRFGLAHPARYGVLFAERRMTARDDDQAVPDSPGGPESPDTPDSPDSSGGSESGPEVHEFGAEAFAQLVQGIRDCAEAGVSASTDPVADATAVWVALHGTVTLRTALPGYPWPELGRFTRQLVVPLARITA